MKKIIGLVLTLLAIIVLAFWTLNQPKDQPLTGSQESGQVQQQADNQSNQDESEVDQASETQVTTEVKTQSGQIAGPVNQGPVSKLPRTPLLDSQGQKVVLADLIDKPTLINFWASWCPPCKGELPYFQKAYEEYGDRVNFVMLNATLSRPSETLDQALAYIEEEGYSFPVYFDQDYANQTTFSVTSLPSTLLLDEDGKILRAIRGIIPEEELFKIIEESLQ